MAPPSNKEHEKLISCPADVPNKLDEVIPLLGEVASYMKAQNSFQQSLLSQLRSTDKRIRALWWVTTAAFILLLAQTVRLHLTVTEFEYTQRQLIGLKAVLEELKTSLLESVQTAKDTKAAVDIAAQQAEDSQPQFIPDEEDPKKIKIRIPVKADDSAGVKEPPSVELPVEVPDNVHLKMPPAPKEKK